MERLYRLFEKHYGCTPVDAVPLTGSASNRQYFRLTDGTRSCVGVVGTMTEENHAFLTMASHFRSKGLPVPEVYSVSEDGMAYIQEDLGDTILYNKVCEDFKTSTGLHEARYSNSFPGSTALYSGSFRSGRIRSEACLCSRTATAWG